MCSYFKTSGGTQQQKRGILMVEHLKEKGAQEKCGSSISLYLTQPAVRLLLSVSVALYTSQRIWRSSLFLFLERLTWFHCSQCHEAIKQALCCGRRKVFFCVVISRIFYFNTPRWIQNITACFCIALEFNLSFTTQAWCFSVGFDIEKAAQCFDSFQTMMKRKNGGLRWKRKGEWGEVGVAVKES